MAYQERGFKLWHESFGNRHFNLFTTDAQATAEADNYVTDAVARGLRIGDRVTIYEIVQNANRLTGNSQVIAKTDKVVFHNGDTDADTVTSVAEYFVSALDVAAGTYSLTAL